MERNLKNSILLALITGVMSFVGAVGGTLYQSHLAKEQKFLDNKITIYGNFLEKIGILPVHLKPEFNLNSMFPKNPETDPLYLERLWNFSDSEIKNLIATTYQARFISNKKLSEKLSKLLEILEESRRINQDSEKDKLSASNIMASPYSKQYIRDLCSEIEVLMREEIS